MTTLSLCMIVRDVEEQLHDCLLSVEKYVDEIVIVDTGSADRTRDIARAHGARVYEFTAETNPQDFILDDATTGAPPPYTNQRFLGNFGAARNLSFSEATKDFCLWLDSDDVVSGAENIPSIVKEMVDNNLICSWLRYDYSFDGDVPNCQLWRERIVKRGCGRWLSPVHEVYELPQGGLAKFFHNVVIKHMRHLKPSRAVANRNYKILKKQYEKTKDNLDARILFYLGNESKYMNPAESMGYYEEYLKLSGWAEERSIARIFLGQLYEAKGDLESAFKCYSSATTDYAPNPDPWFCLARLAYTKKQWDKCCEYTEKGLPLGNPDSAIMYNPLDRTYHPHLFYNVALNHLGRVHEALESAEAGLKARPGDTNLQHNRKLYIEYLGSHIPQPRPRPVTVDLSSGLASEGPRLPHPVLAELLLQVWRESIYHDEVAKAQELLESVPYFLEDEPAVVEAKKKTEKLLAFTKSKESLRAYYSTHAASEAIPLDEEIPPIWPQYPRFQAILLGLGERKSQRILDVGCQDGWVSNRLAKMGHSVVGIDFSPAYLEIARRNAKRLHLDATYVEGFAEDLEGLSEHFDVIICGEVIEHVIDPQALLKGLRSRLKPDGILLLSTPKGAWFGGKPKFVLAGVKVGHDLDEPREHIRAFSLKGLQSLVEKFFYVQSCYSLPSPSPDVPGQCNIFVTATVRYPAWKNTYEKSLNIIIWTGPAFEWWDPLQPDTKGIGGSETACIEMSKELVKLGHKVTVYSDCPLREGLYDGVEYRHFGELQGKETTCDVYINSRQPTALIVPGTIVKAGLKILWVHDIYVGDSNPFLHQCMLQFDRILCLSNWHRKFFLEKYPWLDPSRVLVTRNGINLSRFRCPERVRDNRLIYTSSADRGLELLLDLFPRIKEKVPDVELDVYYGFAVWKSCAAGNQAELDRITEFEQRLKNTAGVNWHDRVNQQTLAEAWLNAKVWAYPTMFTETSCISAMEAQVAGAVPVTTDIAALSETVQTGYKLKPPTDEAYQAEFVQRVVELLTNENLRWHLAQQGMKHAENLTWSALAREWSKKFQEWTEDVKVNPMHEYRVG